MKNILNRITIGGIEDIAESEKVEYLGEGYLRIEFEGFDNQGIEYSPYIQRSRFMYSVPQKDGEICRGSYLITGDFNYLEALEEMNDFLAKDKYLTHAKYKGNGFWNRCCWKLSGRFYQERKI